MIIYNYHPITKELTFAGLADPDPMETGNWLIPAHSTIAQPPAEVEGKTRHFVDGEWTYKDVPEPETEPTPAPLEGDALLAFKILEIEATITPRRLREAVLGIDKGWLLDKNSQIAKLRASMTKE